MTDKQIIIDGVDVSGCEHFRETLPSGCLGKYRCNCDSINTMSLNCEENNCVYKQLKAKEQECEGLRYEVGSLENDRDILQEQLDQLKAENEKYALFIEKLCDYAGLECDSEEQAMRTLSDLASQMNKARWIIDRYKQTLTEIKEIAEKGCYDDCGMPLDECSIILQKISEVENVGN